MDRADIADRFRNELVRPADGDTIIPLGLEHALLEIASQEKEQGQADTEQDAQARAQMEDDGEDAEMVKASAIMLTTPESKRFSNVSTSLTKSDVTAPASWPTK